MSETNPITAFFLSFQKEQEDLDKKFRERVATTSIQSQRAQDENLGPDIRAMDPYLRHESRDFNKFQFKHSALKNTAHGCASSWKAATAYAQTEVDTRNAILEELAKESK